MTIPHVLLFKKRKLAVFLLWALVVAPNGMASQTTKFFPGLDENEDDLVRAISIQYDAASNHAGYRLIEETYPGVLLKQLSSGGALMAQEEGDGYSLSHLSVNGSVVSLHPIAGISVPNLATIDIREGDGGTFHVGWLEPDLKTLRYAHMDARSDKCCISVAGYRLKEKIKTPPPDFLVPHVLVGRGVVATLRGSHRDGNPIAVMNLYTVRGKVGTIESGAKKLETTTIRGKGEDETETIKTDLAVGLVQSSLEFEVGSWIQPDAIHAWYGQNYLSLAHHLDSSGNDLILKLVAMGIPDSSDIESLFHYEKPLPSNVSVLSNLAEPINSYRAGLGRGGLAWLEARPGHKVYINIFRDSSLDTAIALNPEIAGAVSVEGLSGESLYWLDLGENFEPVIFILTGDSLLYQVDLDDPDNFTEMPDSDLLYQTYIWPPMDTDDENNIAFVMGVDEEDQVISVYRVYREWRRTNYEYHWEQLDQY